MHDKSETWLLTILCWEHHSKVFRLMSPSSLLHSRIALKCVEMNKLNNQKSLKEKIVCWRSSQKPKTMHDKDELGIVTLWEYYSWSLFGSAPSMWICSDELTLPSFAPLLPSSQTTKKKFGSLWVAPNLPVFLFCVSHLCHLNLILEEEWMTSA